MRMSNSIDHKAFDKLTVKEFLYHAMYVKGTEEWEVVTVLDATIGEFEKGFGSLTIKEFLDMVATKKNKKIRDLTLKELFNDIVFVVDHEGDMNKLSLTTGDDQDD